MTYCNTVKNILMRPFFNFIRRRAAHNETAGLLLKLNKVGAFVGINLAVFSVTSIYLSFKSVSVITMIMHPLFGINYEIYCSNSQGVF